MVLFGVFLILAGLLGAYVSNSSQLTVLIFYEIFSAVIMSFLLLWAAFCFYQMSLVDDSVDKHWDRLGDESADNDEERTPEEEEERKDAAASVFKSWLLVTGVLETVLAFFQLVNFLAAHALFQVLQQKPGATALSQWHLLSMADKGMYTWSIISACVHIFVDGTHAIFSRHVTPKEWFLVVFDAIGRIDSRYIDGDSSIAAMEFLLALFVGPGCLVFAWSIYTKQAHRHILGLIVCSTQLYTQALYYAITIHEGYRTITVSAEPGWVVAFVAFQGLRTLLPLFIFVWCFRKSVSSLEQNERYKTMLLELGLKRRDMELQTAKQRLQQTFDQAKNGHPGRRRGGGFPIRDVRRRAPRSRAATMDYEAAMAARN